VLWTPSQATESFFSGTAGFDPQPRTLNPQAGGLDAVPSHRKLLLWHSIVNPQPSTLMQVLWTPTQATETFFSGTAGAYSCGLPYPCSTLYWLAQPSSYAVHPKS